MLWSWLFHVPRFFVGHLFGHAALLVRWFSYALDGLSDALTQVARILCDVAPDEELYEGFDDPDDDGGGLSA